MTNNGVIEKYCYNNDVSKCTQYGGLYQWNEIMQYTSLQGAQGICPTGWHLPSTAEWTEMLASIPSPDKGSRLATNAALWNDGPLDQSPHFGTINFFILPAGRCHIGGPFFNEGYYTSFWTSTEFSSNDAYSHYLYDYFTGVNQDYDSKAFARSVRCVKD